MIRETIIHTPMWVFILFLGLLYLGYSQTKDRQIKAKRVFILPVGMVFLSLFGLYSAFGLTLFSLGFWVLGLTLSFVLGLKFIDIKHIRYENTKDSFYINGSWFHLVLILTVFFIKYFIGVMTAKQLPLINQDEFIVFVSLLYGFISGLFLARSFCILRSKNTKSA